MAISEVLHYFHDRIFTARRKPVRYYRCITGSGGLGDVCSPGQIYKIRVVEKKAQATGDGLYGAALLLYNGDQILVREFECELSRAQEAARELAETLRPETM